MQVRAAVLPTRPVSVKPAAAPTTAQAPGAAPQPAQPIKARNADRSFGSEIFQHGLYALMNLGQIIPLGSLGGLLQMLPKSTLGVFNVVMGGMNAFKDWRSLKAPENTKNSDNYTRLAGDAGMIVGGVALLAGAAVAPIIPLIGAGLAGVGYLARIVGVWNDESRI